MQPKGRQDTTADIPLIESSKGFVKWRVTIMRENGYLPSTCSAAIQTSGCWYEEARNGIPILVPGDKLYERRPSPDYFEEGVIPGSCIQ